MAYSSRCSAALDEEWILDLILEPETNICISNLLERTINLHILEKQSYNLLKYHLIKKTAMW